MSVGNSDRFQKIEAELERVRGLRRALDEKFRRGGLDSSSYSKCVGIVEERLRVLLEEQRSIFEAEKIDLLGVLGGLEDGSDRGGRVDDIRALVRRFDSLLDGVDREVEGLSGRRSVSGVEDVGSLFSPVLWFVLFVLGVFALFSLFSVEGLFFSLFDFFVLFLVLCVGLVLVSLIFFVVALVSDVGCVSFRLSFDVVLAVFVAFLGLSFFWGLFVGSSFLVFVLDFVVSLGVAFWIFRSVFSASWVRVLFVSLVSRGLWFVSLFVFSLVLSAVLLL